MPGKVLKMSRSTASTQVDVWKKSKITEKYPQVQDPTFKDLERGLSILKISNDEFQAPWLSTEEISELLVEVFNLPSTPIGITRAFAKSGGKNKNQKSTLLQKNNRISLYKLSHPGEILLGSIWGKGHLSILYLEANSHRTAYEGLKDLIGKLKGKELNVVDPYYGVNTIKVIEEMVRAGKSVKFLSSKTSESSSIIQRELDYVRKHYPGKIEFRVYPTNELHDRYILASNSFVIVGQGVKDLGNKESLILVIDDRFGKDIRKELEKSFWRRWQDKASISL